MAEPTRGLHFWQRLRPCVRREADGGPSAAELQLIIANRDLEIAAQERVISELRGQLDAAVRKAENLADLVRDIRELTGREGS